MESACRIPFFVAVDLLQGCAYNIERTITEEDIMDIKQLEQYLMQSDLGIDAKQLERFLSECDLDDKGFPPEELVSYIRRQIYDFKRLMAYYRCAIMEIETKFNVINEDFPTNTSAIRLKASRAASRSRRASATSWRAVVSPSAQPPLKKTSSTSPVCAWSAPLWTMSIASPTRSCSRTTSR